MQSAKKCSMCFSEKNVDFFYHHAFKKTNDVIKDVVYPVCLNCKNRKPITKRSTTKDFGKAPRSVKSATIKTKYGINLKDYEVMLSKQGNGCGICGRSENSIKKHKYFSIDHNHITGEVRGLLCSNCNFALGHFKVDEVGSKYLFLASNYINNSESEKKFFTKRLA